MYKKFPQHWRKILATVAISAFGLSIVRVFLAPGRPTMALDSALFQHAGWYVTQGATPYVDIWDIKPPLVVETTTFLAVLSSGNMYHLHLLSVIATAAAGVGTVYLTAVLTYELTSNETSGFVAGLTVLTFAAFHYLPATGFRPRYFAMFFGLSAILLQLRGFHFASGAATAMGVGFTQHTIIFLLLTLGLVVQERSRRNLVLALVGVLVVTFAMVLPIVLLGAFVPMIVEVILVPLSVSESTGVTSILVKFARGILNLGYASIPVLLGVYGLLRVAPSKFRDTWWVVIGGTVYATQVLFIDFDGVDDLFFVLLFVSIGCGLLVDSMRKREVNVISIAVAVAVTISVFWLGGGGIVSSPVNKSSQDTMLWSTIQYTKSAVGAGYQGTYLGSNSSIPDASQYGPSKIEHIYWNKVKPESCHYRLSGTEAAWIKKTNRPVIADECGQFPG